MNYNIKAKALLAVTVIAIAAYGCVSAPPKRPPAWQESSDQLRAKLAEAQALAKGPLACGKWHISANTEFFGPRCDWLAQCEYDDIRDRAKCRITKPGVHYGVTVLLIDDLVGISVGHSHYPGHRSAVRVDDQPPVFTSNTVDNQFAIADGVRIVAAMETGRVIASSVSTWPHAIEKKERHTLEGFPQALEYSRNWLSTH